MSNTNAVFAPIGTFAHAGGHIVFGTRTLCTSALIFSVLGSTDEELSALFAANGFTDYRSELRALVDIHDNADSLLRWSEASAFGNFLEAFAPAERSLVRQAFARLVEDKRTPEGLSLERYLRFAFVRKAPTAN